MQHGRLVTLRTCSWLHECVHKAYMYLELMDLPATESTPCASTAVITSANDLIPSKSKFSSSYTDQRKHNNNHRTLLDQLAAKKMLCYCQNVSTDRLAVLRTHGASQNDTYTECGSHAFVPGDPAILDGVQSPSQ